MFGLDAGHNSVVVHPPRQPAGELEVRQDTCLSDPIAVAPLPPGPTGGQDQLTVPLPARPGRHDLCLTFTALTFDPLLAVDWAGLAPPAAARP
jgi:hexosaminidase